MRIKKFIRSQAFLSASVYVVALAAFFAADLLISRLGTDSEIASWGALKSSVFIGASLCMLGMDQILVRNPNHCGRIIKLVAIQIIAVAGVLSVIYAQIGTLPHWLTGYAAIVAVAASTLTAAFFRAKFRMIDSQLAVNGWRFAFGCLVGVCFLTETARYPALLIVIAVAVTQIVIHGFGGFQTVVDRTFHPDTEVSTSQYYRVGLRFCISAFFLNFALYVEQLVLKADHQVAAAATYFRYSTLFLMPSVAAVGFLGFYLGPLIRLNGEQFRTVVKNNFPIIIVGTLCFALIALIPGLVFLKWFAESEETIVLPLLACMFGIACFRILMVLPSAYLGVNADSRTLDRFLAWNVVGVVLLFVVYRIMTIAGYRSDVAIAAGSLSNWATRASLGLWLTVSMINNQSKTALTEGKIACAKGC